MIQQKTNDIGATARFSVPYDRVYGRAFPSDTNPLEQEDQRHHHKTDNAVPEENFVDFRNVYHPEKQFNLRGVKSRPYDLHQEQGRQKIKNKDGGKKEGERLDRRLGQFGPRRIPISADLHDPLTHSKRPSKARILTRRTKNGTQAASENRH